MVKNAVISLLTSTIIFTTEAYIEMFSVFAFLSVAVIAFVLVCMSEDVIEEVWNYHMHEKNHMERERRTKCAW